jgi:uncharacterized membrane protein YhaH (DUF805 family)
MDLMFQPLRKYADFQGRARRSEYWLFTLLIVIVDTVFFVLSALAGQDGLMNLVIMCLLVLVSLGLFIPSLAVSFRRLHDTDRSAWWLLIGLLPFIGGLVLLVFTLLPGTLGANRFGPDPKTQEEAVFA